MLKKQFLVVYPSRVYKTLARACYYSRVPPNYVQPVFIERDGLTYEACGFAVGPAYRNGIELRYRKRV